jgi:integrase
MARKVRNSTLESRSARLKLAIRRKPHSGPSLARGVMLLYRRNKTNGRWVVKASDGHGAYWTKAFADADDYENADGSKVLTFFTAQDRAKQLARGSTDTPETAPITVAGALEDYESDLAARAADTYNARWPKAHLTAVLLAKPVQLLSARELRRWRDSLLAETAPATINRLCNALCAALELARQHDPRRIQNRDAWETGLAGLPDAQRARNVVLPDDKVHAFVVAAYACDHALGLLVETLAVTGARPSQAVRLRVEDLHAHPSKPKLTMPKSGKGGGRNRSQRRSQRYSVPITPLLAKKLKQAAVGRAPHSPLLVRADGSSWGDDPSNLYRSDIREVVASIGEDPDKVTLYALRHSNIVRMLLANVPVRVIASLHNTSISQIERNYSAFITEHSDEVSRGALLHEPPSADATVVSISGR